MNQPIFLEPVFQERIWGGTKLQQLFGYEIPNDRTGECWAISAHPNGQSVVKSGPYQGLKLGELTFQHSSNDRDFLRGGMAAGGKSKRKHDSALGRSSPFNHDSLCELPRRLDVLHIVHQRECLQRRVRAGTADGAVLARGGIERRE